MAESAYAPDEVTAIQVTLLREYGDGLFAWWVRDLLDEDSEGGACGIDAPTAYAAAEIAATWAGGVLSGSFRVEGERVTYGIAHREERGNG